MTAKVHLLPSDHEFLVEKGETILEAALRSGLNVNYHCNNGTCCECKARVVSGEPGESLPFDCRLSSQEKKRGVVLLCRCQVKEANDLVIEAAEARTPADIPRQKIHTTVYRLDRPAEDIAILQLRTPRSNTLRFLAGQHVTLRIPGIKPRNKSIASCPCNGMDLQFHIRYVPGDEFSEYVFHRLKKRDKVLIEGPYGEFGFDDESTRPIIFLAYETGFSPLKSLIEHAISLDLTQPMRLYWIARHNEDHYFANLCRSWEDALDDFKYIPVNSADEHELSRILQQEYSMEIDGLSQSERDLLKAGLDVVGDYPDLSGFDVYVNGPESLLEPTRHLFLKHNISPERLFVDHLEKIQNY